MGIVVFGAVFVFVFFVPVNYFRMISIYPMEEMLDM